MDNLIFYTSLTLLAYYFLVHLPSQKKPITSSLSTKSTQTDPLTETSPETIQQLEAEKSALLKDQQQKECTIQGLNQSYEKLETKKNQALQQQSKEIQELKKQIQQLSHSQSQEQQDLGKALDQLIKGINDLNKEL